MSDSADVLFHSVSNERTFDMRSFEGTVQQRLKGVESGISRQVSLSCWAGDLVFKFKGNFRFKSQKLFAAS